MNGPLVAALAVVGLVTGWFLRGVIFASYGEEKLMRRVHRALKQEGKAITLEFVPNEDRVSPPMAAAFSLVMLAGTDRGDAYTFAEYLGMFSNAGFAKTTLHPVPEVPQQVVLSEK